MTLSKNLFPKPVEIEYISLAYNGVTYFYPALHATRAGAYRLLKRDIFFRCWFFFCGNHLHTRAWVASHADVDLRGIREECLTNVTNPLNILLTSSSEARAWAACGVLCRPIFDCRWTTNQNSFLFKK